MPGVGLYALIGPLLSASMFRSGDDEAGCGPDVGRALPFYLLGRIQVWPAAWGCDLGYAQLEAEVALHYPRAAASINSTICRCKASLLIRRNDLLILMP